MVNKVTNLFVLLALSIPLFLNASQVMQKSFRFDTPWLGVMLADVSDKKLEDLGVENGIWISKVFDGSPADKAGLKADDIVVTFDGDKIYSHKDLSGSVKMKKVNDVVDLEYFRDGKINSATLTIEKRKSPQVFMKKAPKVFKKKIHHSKNSVFLGVKVEKLTDQLREYFNVSDGLGVLVAEVVEESPAEKAGLKAGDVITKIEEREVKNYHDLIRGLNYFDPNDEVEVFYVRDKSKTSVDVKLSEPQDKFEKMLWIDKEDFMHDFDFDIEQFEEIDEEEIELKLEELDKKIKIKKEIGIKGEV